MHEGRFVNRTLEAYKNKTEQKFITAVVEGDFKPEDMLFSRYEPPGGSLKRTAESEAYIEDVWQEKIQAGLQPWKNDTVVSKLRLVSAEVRDGKLMAVLDPCLSYRDYIGARSPDFAKKFGPEYAVNAVGTAVLLLAKNEAGIEHVLLTVRSDTHDYKPGGIYAATGGLSSLEENPTMTAYRELEEESGVLSTEVDSMVCRGIFINPDVNCLDFVYEARTNLTIEELKKRSHDDENEVIYIPIDKLKLQQWLLALVHAHVPDAIPGLLHIGKERFGNDWYTEMQYALAWRSADAENDKTKLESRDYKRAGRKIRAFKESIT